MTSHERKAIKRKERRLHPANAEAAAVEDARRETANEQRRIRRAAARDRHDYTERDAHTAATQIRRVAARSRNDKTEQDADTARRRLVRKDADRREVEQVADTTARRMVRDDKDRREAEQVADTGARRLVREHLVQRQVEQIADTAARRIVREDLDHRVVEQITDTDARRLVREDPLQRQVEQITNTAARRLVREEPLHRQVEQLADTTARRLAREDALQRQVEQEADTTARRLIRQDPLQRQVEQLADTTARRLAREDPHRREVEQAADTASRRLARAQRRYEDMACIYNPSTRDYKFNQPCGTWNKPCRYGCGYMHLSSSTPGTLKLCCVNGLLAPTSPDMHFMEEQELTPLPPFLCEVIDGCEDFSTNSSTYNNLFSMAATQVCNYLETPGWTNRGPGPAYVTLNGRLHHYMKIARSTDNSLGISYFIYDQVASQASVPNARNVDPTILDKIGTGLKEINRYCIDLQFLGLNSLQNEESITIIPAMPDQREHFDVCSVINNRQTDGMSMRVCPRYGLIGTVHMDSEAVEPLVYPLLFPYGEPGWIAFLKDRLTAGAYLMSRLLKPERDDQGEFMEVESPHPPHEHIDSRTCERFETGTDEAEVEEHRLMYQFRTDEGMELERVDEHGKPYDPEIWVNRILRVNRFMLMARLAQYWVLDVYSRILDHRMNIVDKLSSAIMMGQPRQRPNSEEQIDEDEQEAAGYTNPDYPKKESYVPGSVHGSVRHMTALARNALTLVSQFGPKKLLVDSHQDGNGRLVRSRWNTNHLRRKYCSR